MKKDSKQVILKININDKNAKNICEADKITYMDGKIFQCEDGDKKFFFIPDKGRIDFIEKREFVNEMLAFKGINGKWGYVSKDGNLIEPKYDEAKDFTNDGKALVKENGKEFFIDKSGKCVGEPEVQNSLPTRWFEHPCDRSSSKE